MKRQTRQREAVQHTLGEARSPLSTGELLTATRRAVRGIGIATVYRHLQTMVRQGEAVRVKLPGEPVRYESAGKAHHHHFVCDICEHVFEAPGCGSDFRGMTPRGFTLDRHEVILYGRCAACSDEEGPTLTRVAPHPPSQSQDDSGGSMDDDSTT
jgi:Fur family ferric uptake transcriptional regulator